MRPPDRLVRLPDRRRLALDDVGDQRGRPVLYLHGTPDSRLARHPDDHITAALGVRLLAPDRPGIGASDADPAATPATVADDLVAVLDHLALDRVGVLSWSAGSVFALTLAGAHPDRVDRLVLATPLIPADAYGDAGVLDGADDARRLFADALEDLAPGDVGAELAVWLVPPELDESTARALLADSLAEVGDIPGASEQLVAALRASVAGGMTGVEREITAQAWPLGPLLDAVGCPVTVHVGDHDTVTPAAMGRWIAERVGARVRTHPGEGHALAVRRWRDLVAEAAGVAQASGSSQGTTGTSDQRRSNS